MAILPGRPGGRSRPSPEKATAVAPGGGRPPSVLQDPGSYFLTIIEPVCRYRVWKAKASLNMCGEWRPALGFFMARLK